MAFNSGNSGKASGAAVPLQTSRADPTRDACATVQLSRPLTTHRGDVSEIALRKPNFGDFIDLGQVENLRFSQSEDGAKQQESVIDFERLMRWAVRLSGIDRVILSTLDPIDAYELSKAVIQIANVFILGNLQSVQTSSSSSAALTPGS